MRKTGTVRWFNAAKGFGFITPDDGSVDIYVHHRQIRGTGFKTLADGDSVEYSLPIGQNGNVLQGDKGPFAADVVRL